MALCLGTPKIVHWQFVNFPLQLLSVTKRHRGNSDHKWGAARDHPHKPPNYRLGRMGGTERESSSFLSISSCTELEPNLPSFLFWSVLNCKQEIIGIRHLDNRHVTEGVWLNIPVQNGKGHPSKKCKPHASCASNILHSYTGISK